MRYFVTGSSGFIGRAVCLSLLEEGHEILGIDSMNSYYNPNLKKTRLDTLQSFDNFKFMQLNINDQSLKNIIEDFKPNKVIHLAAQAGVRYSLQNPTSYFENNVQGFFNLLERLKRFDYIEHIVYASSSSVYGLNDKTPFSEEDKTEKPASLYAATKKANELLAFNYSHIYNMSLTGLRFFTVYGPWGRPDMALFKFTKAILAGEKIDIYHDDITKLKRDFTYIDDIVQMTLRIVNKYSFTGEHKVFNLGNSKPCLLSYFVNCIEEKIGKKAILNFVGVQDGDLQETFADNSYLKQEIGKTNVTNLKTGISNFIDWYLEYKDIIPL